jgi:hypothetical protein
VQGDLLVANTVNMVVSDPIMELGANNLNTGDLGIIMTRHGVSNSNVAVFYDETADILKMGYTLGGANDTTITLENDPLSVSIQGTLEVDTANVNTMNVSAIEGLQTLSFSSDSTTVPPLQLTAGSLNDGVGALRIDSVEPDIFLNDTDGGFSTVTFANNGVSRAAFGRNSGDDFYITVRDPATNGGNWRDTSFVVDSSTGDVSMGYGLTSSSLSVAADTNVTGTIGKAKVGYVGYSDNAGFAHYDFASAGNYAFLQASTGQTYINTVTNKKILFRENNVDKMALSGGKLGIGTDSPKEILDVRGPTVHPVVSYASGQDASYLIAAGTTYDGTSTNWATEGIQHRIKTSSGGVPRVTIDTPQSGEVFCVTNNGNVGIGVANPTHKLHVAGMIKSNEWPAWSVNFYGNNTNLPTIDNNMALVSAQIYGSELYDLTNDYDHTTGYFTAPVSGYYYVGLRSLIYVPSGCNRVDAQVIKTTTGGSLNRVIQSERAHRPGANLNLTIEVTGTVYLQQNEKLHPKWAADLGSNNAYAYLVKIGSDFNVFWGHLIQPA